MSADDPRGRLAGIFQEVAAHIDGERLVAEAAGADPAFAAATDVLAVGKVALPMLRGLARARRGDARQRPAFARARRARWRWSHRRPTERARPRPPPSPRRR